MKEKENIFEHKYATTNRNMINNILLLQNIIIIRIRNIRGLLERLIFSKSIVDYVVKIIFDSREYME